MHIFSHLHMCVCSNVLLLVLYLAKQNIIMHVSNFYLGCNFECRYKHKANSDLLYVRNVMSVLPKLWVTKTTGHVFTLTETDSDLKA